MQREPQGGCAGCGNGAPPRVNGYDIADCTGSPNKLAVSHATCYLSRLLAVEAFVGGPVFDLRHRHGRNNSRRRRAPAKLTPGLHRL